MGDKGCSDLSAPLLASSPWWWMHCWEITHACTLEVWFLQYDPEYCTLQGHPTRQGTAAQAAPCVLCPAWRGLGHCRVISSSVKTGLSAAASFTVSLTSDFFLSFLLLCLKCHLVICCLLFKPVDWSSFCFMCKSLPLADTLMTALVVSFTTHFFTLISTLTALPIMGFVSFPRNSYPEVIPIGLYKKIFFSLVKRLFNILRSFFHEITTTWISLIWCNIFSSNISVMLVRSMFEKLFKLWI